MVVDDEPSIRSVLQEYLNLKGYRCQTFDNGQSFCDWLDQLSGDVPVPMCLLCDVSMPTMTGLALQQRLTSRTEIAMVMMSGAASNQDVVTAFRAGAVDFLLKPLDDTMMFQVIDRALQHSTAMRQRQQRQTHFRHRVSLLTSRELDTLQRVAQGRLNRQIAEEFGIALRTVKLYRQRGFEKLGIELNVDLVRLFDEGLL
jgi:FixJ family two-component response regulator